MLTKFSMDWALHRLGDWLIDDMIDWYYDWLIDWMIDWLQNDATSNNNGKLLGGIRIPNNDYGFYYWTSSFLLYTWWYINFCQFRLIDRLIDWQTNSTLSWRTKCLPTDMTCGSNGTHYMFDVNGHHTLASEFNMMCDKYSLWRLGHSTSVFMIGQLIYWLIKWLIDWLKVALSQHWAWRSYRTCLDGGSSLWAHSLGSPSCRHFRLFVQVIRYFSFVGRSLERSVLYVLIFKFFKT